MHYLKTFIVLILLPVFFSGTKVTVVNYEQLQTYIANKTKTNDTLYVVNFWATWCEPCVKEIPAFQQEYQKYANKKVKMMYVSMNSAKDLSKVQNVVDKMKLGPLVLLLAGNPNDFIDKVDSTWSGALPATAMYKLGKKVYFREGEFTSESLDKVIQSKIK